MEFVSKAPTTDSASINISAIQSRLGDLLVSVNGAVDMAEGLAGFVSHGGSKGGSGGATANGPQAVPSSPFDMIDGQINDALSLLVDLKKHLTRVESRVS